MKRFVLFLCFVLIFTPFWAQQPEKHILQFDHAPIEKVLQKLSHKFNVRYSYLDQHIATEHITLNTQDYTLQQVHDVIQQQTNLEILKIDEQYYSIVLKNSDAYEKVEYLDEVIVQSYITQGLSKQLGKTVLNPNKFEILPGVTDADVLLILQQLPGVISPHETASGLHVRGGKIDQNLILWDGIHVYHQGHLFGMISAFNPDATDKVNFYFKGTHPKFGERISSIIDLQTSDRIPNSTEVKTGVNGLNVDFKILTPIVTDKLSFEIAGRKSFTQWWKSPTFNQLAKKVFQNTAFIDFYSENKFGFEDYAAKINFQPRKQTQLLVSNLFIDNVLNFSIPINETENNTNKMRIQNNGMNVQWNEKWNEKWIHNFQLNYSNYRFDYEKLKKYNANFEKFTKDNTVKDYGIDLNFSYLHNENWNLEFGYQLVNNKASHAFMIENPNFILDLDHQNSSNITHTGFFLLKNKWKNWNFQSGCRVSRFQTIGSSSLEPRLIIQNNLTKHWTLQFSFEQKSQLMNQIQESVSSDLSLENYVWGMSDAKKFPLVKANQITSGFTYKNQNWLVDFDFYRKDIKGITSSLYGFFNRFDTEIHTGNGFANGIDVLIQKTTPTWNTSITYSFLNAENRYENINDYHYFPTNSAIKHAVNVNMSKKWNQFSLSAGWNWHTGKPYFTFDTNNKIIGFNDKNLPNYHRMDISGNYQFNTKKNWDLFLGFSIFNVYNRKNLLSKEYQRQYFSFESTINNQLQLVNNYSLGITPNLFLKFRF